jgi:hypothetical protein
VPVAIELEFYTCFLLFLLALLPVQLAQLDLAVSDN